MNTPSIPELDELAFRFFKTFARFEYALKAAGFSKGEKGKARKAEPDWEKFAKSLNGFFAGQHEGPVGAAIRFILDNPPKVQKIDTNEELQWEDEVENGPVARQLIKYIKCVRNNLFHGGKFNGHWFAPDRSKLLMRQSLVVLEACLMASPQVQEAFNEWPDNSSQE